MFYLILLSNNVRKRKDLLTDNCDVALTLSLAVDVASDTLVVAYILLLYVRDDQLIVSSICVGLDNLHSLIGNCD